MTSKTRQHPERTTGKLRKIAKWTAAVAMTAAAVFLAIRDLPHVIESADGRVIGLIAATFVAASVLWLFVRKAAPRWFQTRAENIATLDKCLAVAGVVIAIWALVGEHFWNDLLLSGRAGLAMAIAMLVFALIIGPGRPFGPSEETLPTPGSKSDVIDRRTIDRVWGKLRVESGHNEAPSDRDYAYMFATYAASRLDDAEKQALIKTVLASMDDAVQAAVPDESATTLGSQISSPEPGRTT